jgi:hypothetical protein
MASPDSGAVGEAGPDPTGAMTVALGGVLPEPFIV